ncbi:MAG: inositol monophosphatase [Desulfobacteraceae bacterium]|nr:inositol monophosphatase [Desulfobacteraceae bacterium]MCF8094960.1 inositol monophosphatase [Desulfobacteraceae bacterium]
MDYNYIKNAAIGAAYGAAKILRSHMGHLEHIGKKGPEDLVTSADLESESHILASLREKFPDHDVLAEESGGSLQGKSSCQWIIDPLDGTTNFAHQLPIFSVSIAFAKDGKLRVGVVLNPVTGDLFTATSGEGAVLNGRAIEVSGCGRVSESLLVTGFPYDVKQDTTPYIKRFEQCLKAARGIRRLGSAALDLCFVACGRFEGFWEQGLKPWDTAAGTLIAREAGAMVSDFSGAAYEPDKNMEILATNGYIHEELRSILRL